jgi:hypothetical protein
MGLGKVFTPGFLGCPKFKINWDMYSFQELKPTLAYDKVMELLHQNPNGEYLALQALFGKEMAMRVANRGEVLAPATTIRSNLTRAQ